MTARRRFCAAGTLLLAVALAGCAPEPAPTPTPTGFTSEEEAFAAAEATYRAYVDALNQVDLADPATFEPLFALTTGEANEAARTSFSQMHADKWVVEGDSIITVVEPLAWQEEDQAVDLAICVDVSAVTLVDADGQSQVGERPPEQSLLSRVEFNGAEWQISTFSGRDGDPTCKR